jgi:hypothetical protein
LQFGSNFGTVMRIANDPPPTVLCHAERAAGATVEHRVPGATNRCQHCGFGWCRDDGPSEGAIEERVSTLMDSNRHESIINDNDRQ